MIDLHVHTTASDGQYSPTDIIGKATEKNIKIIAITDHDTVSGLEEGKIAAKKAGITLVPGIELNIQGAPLNINGEFHLLGLGLKQISSSLTDLIEEIINNRLERNQEIIKRFRLTDLTLLWKKWKPIFLILCWVGLILQQNL